MNLYDKIYKAINEGVVKSLTITDEQDNQQVNYARSKVNSYTYTKDQFDEVSKEFIDNPNPVIQNYNKVLAYSMFGMWKYIVKDYNDFINIFDKISKITDNIDLSWIDTTNALTFIMKNGEELSLDDIDNVNNVMFIKFNNIQDFNHPVIIHKNLLIINDIIWSDIKVDTKLNDKKDGYKNTYNVNIINNLKDYPAFKYCVNQSINRYKGYLPAIDELKFLSKNENLINHILKYVKEKELNITSIYWWSSTQHSATKAWFLLSGQPNYFDKKYEWYILPFFREIN